MKTKLKLFLKMKQKGRQCIRAKSKKFGTSPSNRKAIEDDIADFLEKEISENKATDESDPIPKYNIYLSQKYDPSLAMPAIAVELHTQVAEEQTSLICESPPCHLSQQVVNDFEALLSEEKFKNKQKEYCAREIHRCIQEEEQLKETDELVAEIEKIQRKRDKKELYKKSLQP